MSTYYNRISLNIAKYLFYILLLLKINLLNSILFLDWFKGFMVNNISENQQYNPSDSIFKKVKYMVLYALNPIQVLEEKKFHKWYLYLILPAVGWMLFFLQVGLDKYYNFWRVLLISLLGLVMGYIFVAVTGWLLTLILNNLGNYLRNDQVISLIALSHTYMASSVLLGLIYNIFGHSSSASFGIAGLMCTLLPIYAGIRTLSKNRVFLAPTLATLVGILLLISWQFILKIVN